MASTSKAAAPSHRRSRARRGEGDLLRDEILQAAERLLIETGDENAVSIRMVADAVGVTPPSIYLHFEDKNRLMFAVCEAQFSRFSRYVRDAIAGMSDPVERLRELGRAYVRFGVSHPEPYRILFMSQHHDLPPDVDPQQLEGMAAFRVLVDAVQDCIAAGALPRGDAVLMATCLWAGVHGVTSLHIAFEKDPAELPWPQLDDLVEAMLSSMFVGLQATFQGENA